MNVMTYEFRWRGWMFSVLKTAMICLGILVGVYFTDALKPWTGVVWAVFGVTVSVSAYLGLSSLRGAVNDDSNER